MSLSPERLARLEIRDAIDDWMIWRDTGDWERLAGLWHPDGRMRATWFQASGADFVARSRAAFEAGMTVLHVMGGTSIDVAGGRAVSQTRSTIIQRGAVDGVAVDVTCHGRFVDAWERAGGRWLLLLRQPVYELDHLLTLEPGAALRLDPTLLGSFPAGYRHLAYLQSNLGFAVNRDMPGTRGAAADALRSRVRAWLGGAAPATMFDDPETRPCA